MTTPFTARRLDRGEALFWFLDRFSPMNFAVVAEGSGRLDELALQEALAAAQRRHPLLTVAIEADAEHRLHFVPRPRQVLPSSRMAAADWHSELAELIVEPFVLGEAPLMRACHVADGDRWVIALIFHHSIGDARSGFTVLSEVLQGVAGVGIDDTPLPAQPPMSAVYPPEFMGDAGRQLAGQIKA
ncbi:MAG: hypothetical protein WBO88_15860, partial [Candidatus Dechloromonas phosphoritropha]